MGNRKLSFAFLVNSLTLCWFLDAFLPRVIELATTSSDRQTKVYNIVSSKSRVSHDMPYETIIKRFKVIQLKDGISSSTCKQIFIFTAELIRGVQNKLIFLVFKVVACELLHALTLFVLGKSTQQTNQNTKQVCRLLHVISIICIGYCIFS